MEPASGRPQRRGVSLPTARYATLSILAFLYTLPVLLWLEGPRLAAAWRAAAAAAGRTWMLKQLTLWGSRSNGPSALFDGSAPPASLDDLKAQGSPTLSGGQPQPLGSLRWPQEGASGRPKDEEHFHF